MCPIEATLVVRDGGSYKSNTVQIAPGESVEIGDDESLGKYILSCEKDDKGGQVQLTETVSGLGYAKVERASGFFASRMPPVLNIGFQENYLISLYKLGVREQLFVHHSVPKDLTKVPYK